MGKNPSPTNSSRFRGGARNALVTSYPAAGTEHEGEGSFVHKTIVEESQVRSSGQGPQGENWSRNHQRNGDTLPNSGLCKSCHGKSEGERWLSPTEDEAATEALCLATKGPSLSWVCTTPSSTQSMAGMRCQPWLHSRATGALGCPCLLPFRQGMSQGVSEAGEMALPLQACGSNFNPKTYIKIQVAGACNPRVERWRQRIPRVYRPVSSHQRTIW